jgi:hypothetical protein
MTEEIDRQSIVDAEHLRLVSLGFLVSAGIAAFFALFGMIYVLVGILMSIALAHAPATSRSGGPPPAFIGWIFGGMGLLFLLLGLGVAAARFWAARCVKQRKSQTYCMVIAAIGCLEFPYGTALGVLSLMVLGRDSVTKLFAANR